MDAFGDICQHHVVEGLNRVGVPTLEGGISTDHNLCKHQLSYSAKLFGIAVDVGVSQSLCQELDCSRVCQLNFAG